MENKSKWFYAINRDCGDNYSELEYEISENPTDEELDKIAQEILRGYGYTDADDYVSIGKGELITIEELGSDLGVEIIERLEEIAGDMYDCEELLFGVAQNEDIKDLDRRIAQTLKEWAAERNVMDSYYTIPDTKSYYYHGDNNAAAQSVADKLNED